LEDEARQDASDSRQGLDLLDEVLGTSLSMRPIQEAIRKVAMTEVPALITGESGTGKELVARAIHERSERAGGPFVPVACGVIPPALFERELFGHEPGGDSPASSRKKGKVEVAQGGTLFLDEVADLPADSQRTVLRLVEEQTERAEVRILASAKRSEQAMSEGEEVQPDLYRQLATHINLPPLRERGDDVLVLAKLFLRRVAARQGDPILGFTKTAADAMRAHAWPGNVRELAARIQRGVVVAEGQYIEAADLELQKEEPSFREDSISIKVNQQRIETDLIMKAFTLSRGNLSRAAQELGISRSTLYRRIRQYGLDRAADANVF
jgi:two-component system NtrC family response regulator